MHPWWDFPCCTLGAHLSDTQMPLRALLTLLINEESCEGQEVCKAILRWQERKEGLRSLVHHSRGLEPSTAVPAGGLGAFLFAT